MQVFVVLDEKNEVILLGGRSDFPICADFSAKVKRGETAFGMSFDELKQLDGFETDPEDAGKVIQMTPRVRAKIADSALPAPVWLKKVDVS